MSADKMKWSERMVGGRLEWFSQNAGYVITLSSAKGLVASLGGRELFSSTKVSLNVMRRMCQEHRDGGAS